jgi:amylosucrase
MQEATADAEQKARAVGDAFNTGAERARRARNAIAGFGDVLVGLSGGGERGNRKKLDEDFRGESTVDLAVDRLLLGYAMVFGFGGIPLIWMGDELALPDDETYQDEPLHADDNRWLHRPRMDWALAHRCETPDPGDDDLQVRASSRTLHGMRTLARARAALPPAPRSRRCRGW